MTRPRIEIEGIREFQGALRQLDADLPKRIRVVLNEATNIVIDYARPRVPTRTGRARASLKAQSSQREARVVIGGARAPYVPWLDFGGQGPAGRPAPRPFITEGRYLYPSLRVKAEDFTRVMDDGLRALAEGAGLELD